MMALQQEGQSPQILQVPTSQILNRLEQMRSAQAFFIQDRPDLLEKLNQAYAQQKAKVGLLHSIMRVSEDQTAARRAAALTPDRINSEEQVFDFMAQRLRYRLSGRNFALLTDQDVDYRMQLVDEIGRIGRGLDPSRARKLRQVALAALEEATVSPQEAAQKSVDFQRRWQEARQQVRAKALGRGIPDVLEAPLAFGVGAVRSVSEVLEGLADLIPGVEVQRGEFGDAIAGILGAGYAALSGEDAQVADLTAKAVARIGRPLPGEAESLGVVNLFGEAGELLGIVLGFKGVGGFLGKAGKGLGSFMSLSEKTQRVIAAKGLTKLGATGFLFGAGRERGAPIADRALAGLQEAGMLTAMIGGGQWLSKLPAKLRNTALARSFAGEAGISFMESVTAVSPFLAADPRFREHIAAGELGKAALVASPTIGVFGLSGMLGSRARADRALKIHQAEEISNRITDQNTQAQRQAGTVGRIAELEQLSIASKDIDLETFRSSIKDWMIEFAQGGIPKAEFGQRLQRHYNEAFGLRDTDWEPLDAHVYENLGSWIRLLFKTAADPAEIRVDKPLAEFTDYARELLKAQNFTADTIEDFLIESVGRAAQKKIDRLKDPALSGHIQLRDEIRRRAKSSNLPIERLLRQVGVRTNLDQLELDELRRARNAIRWYEQQKGTKPAEIQDKRTRALLQIGGKINKIGRDLDLDVDNVILEIGLRETIPLREVPPDLAKRVVDFTLARLSSRAKAAGKLTQFRQGIEKLKLPKTERDDIMAVIDVVSQMRTNPQDAWSLIGTGRDPNRTLEPQETRALANELSARLNRGEADALLEPFLGRTLTEADAIRIRSELDRRRPIRTERDLSGDERRAMELMRDAIPDRPDPALFDSYFLALEEIAPAKPSFMARLNQARARSDGAELRSLVEEAFLNPVIRPPETIFASAKGSLDLPSRRAVDGRVLTEMAWQAELRGERGISAEDAQAIAFQARRMGIDFRAPEVSSKAEVFAERLDAKLQEEARQLLPLAEPEPAEPSRARFREELPRPEREGRRFAKPPSKVPRGTSEREVPQPVPVAQKTRSSRQLEPEEFQRVASLLSGNFRRSRPQNVELMADVAIRLGVAPEGASREQVRDLLSGDKRASLEIRNAVRRVLAKETAKRPEIPLEQRDRMFATIKEPARQTLKAMFARVEAEAERLSPEQRRSLDKVRSEIGQVVSGDRPSLEYVTDVRVRELLNQGAKTPYPEELPIYRPEDSHLVNRRVDRPTQWERAIRTVSTLEAARVAFEREGMSGFAEASAKARDRVVANLQANMSKLIKDMKARHQTAQEDATPDQRAFIQKVVQSGTILRKRSDFAKLFGPEKQLLLEPLGVHQSAEAMRDVQEFDVELVPRKKGNELVMEITGRNGTVRLSNRLMWESEAGEATFQGMMQAAKAGLGKMRWGDDLISEIILFKAQERPRAKRAEYQASQEPDPMQTLIAKEDSAADICACFFKHLLWDNLWVRSAEKQLMSQRGQQQRYLNNDFRKGADERMRRLHLDPVAAKKGAEVDGLIYDKGPRGILGDLQAAFGFPERQIRGTAYVEQAAQVTNRLRDKLVKSHNSLFNKTNGAFLTIKEGDVRSKILYGLGQLDAVTASRYARHYRQSDPELVRASNVVRNVLQEARQDIQAEIRRSLATGEMTEKEARKMGVAFDQGIFGVLEGYMPRLRELDPEAASVVFGGEDVARELDEMRDRIFAPRNWDPTKIPEGKPDAIFLRNLKDGQHYKRDAVWAVPRYVTKVYKWLAKRELNRIHQAAIFGVNDFATGRTVPELEFIKQGDFVYERGKNLDKKTGLEAEKWVVVRNHVNDEMLSLKPVGTADPAKAPIRLVSYSDLLDGKTYGVRTVGLAEFGKGEIRRRSPRPFINPEAAWDVTRRPDMDKAIHYMSEWLHDVTGFAKGSSPWEKFSDFLAQAQYHNLLGFLNPKAAATNLTGKLNTIGEIGPIWAFRGEKAQWTKEGREILEKHGVFLGLPSITEIARLSPEQLAEKLTGGGGIVQKSFALFDFVERTNRGGAFLGAYLKAKHYGATDLEASRVANQVVARTQFLYDRQFSPKILRSRGARAITTLGTFTHRAAETLVKSFDFIGKADPSTRSEFRKRYVRQMATWMAATWLVGEMSATFMGDDHRVNLMTTLGTRTRDLPFVGQMLDATLRDAGVGPGEVPRTIPIQSAALGPSPAVEALGDLFMALWKANEEKSPEAIREFLRRKQRLLVGRSAVAVFEMAQIAELNAQEGLEDYKKIPGWDSPFVSRIVRAPAGPNGEVPDKPFIRIQGGRQVGAGLDHIDFVLDHFVPGSILARERKWDIGQQVRLDEQRQAALSNEMYAKLSQAQMTRDREDLIEARQFFKENARKITVNGRPIDSYAQLRAWYERESKFAMTPPEARTLITQRSLSERLGDLIPGGAAAELLELAPAQALLIVNSVARNAHEMSVLVGQGKLTPQDKARWAWLRSQIRKRLESR